MSRIEPFFHRLTALQKQKGTCIGVGIDPDPESFVRNTKIEIKRAYAAANRTRFLGPVRTFCKETVNQTAEFASAFVLNSAAFSALKMEDLIGLEYVRRVSDQLGVPVVLDSGRSGFGTTAERCAQEAFLRYGADAVTVNPFFGFEGVLEPFLEYENKGVFVYCRTSNLGGEDFQNVNLGRGKRFYECVAEKAAEWDARYGGGRIGLVVDPLVPAELARIRGFVGKMTILIPNADANPKRIPFLLQAGCNEDGSGLIIGSSRAVAYAPDRALAALELRNLVNGKIERMMRRSEDET